MVQDCTFSRTCLRGILAHSFGDDDFVDDNTIVDSSFWYTGVCNNFDGATAVAVAGNVTNTVFNETCYEANGIDILIEPPTSDTYVVRTPVEYRYIENGLLGPNLWGTYAGGKCKGSKKTRGCKQSKRESNSERRRRSLRSLQDVEDMFLSPAADSESLSVFTDLGINNALTFANAIIEMNEPDRVEKIKQIFGITQAGIEAYS